MSKRDRIRELLALKSEARALATRIDRAIESTFKVGQRVGWDRCGRGQSGRITYVAPSGDFSLARLKVVSDRSGKEYWIHIWNVLVLAERHGEGER